MSLAGYAISAVIMLKTAAIEALANVAEAEVEVAETVVVEVIITREDSGMAEEEEEDTKTRTDMARGVMLNLHTTLNLLTIRTKIKEHMPNTSALNNL